MFSYGSGSDNAVKQSYHQKRSTVTAFIRTSQPRLCLYWNFAFSKESFKMESLGFTWTAHLRHTHTHTRKRLTRSSVCPTHKQLTHKNPFSKENDLQCVVQGMMEKGKGNTATFANNFNIHFPSLNFGLTKSHQKWQQKPGNRSFHWRTTQIAHREEPTSGKGKHLSSTKLLLNKHWIVKQNITFLYTNHCIYQEGGG